MGILRCLESIEGHYREAKEGWRQSSGDKYVKRGVGIGGMWYGIGNTVVRNPSTAKVEMDEKGEVTLFTGAADMGQGSITALVQIACQVLGLAPDSIRVVVADTLHTTNAGASLASRQTYISGNAVLDAARKLAQVISAVAAGILQSLQQSLRIQDGFVYDSVDPSKRVPLKEVAQRAKRRSLPLSFHGYFDPDTTPLDPETGQGVPYATYGFACQMAPGGGGRVDRRGVGSEGGCRPRCGQGRESASRGRPDKRGVSMGVGFALMEEFLLGITTSLRDYHVPTAADMPEVVPIVVEEPEPTGPFGANGVAEPSLIPTAPAILNAIADALGQRTYRLPAILGGYWRHASKGAIFRKLEVRRSKEDPSQEHWNPGKWKDRGTISCGRRDTHRGGQNIEGRASQGHGRG